MIVDLRTPWKVAPLKGKYYGTIILDCCGDEVMKIGSSGSDEDGSKPSVREPIKEPSDWHYETQHALDYANEVIRRVNLT